MIRRLRRDVSSELPKITYSFVPLRIDNNEEYNDAEKEFISFAVEQTEHELSGTNTKLNSYLEKLIQLTINSKFNQASEWIKNFLEIGNKLILFTTSQVALNRMMVMFPEVSVKLDGSVSNYEHKAIIDTFEKNERQRLLICDANLFGKGINLPSINYIAFYELPWTPRLLEETQNMIDGRCINEKINIYFLIAACSIEDKMARLLENKLSLNYPTAKLIEVDSDLLFNDLMKEYRRMTK
jgi:superfamily II DNA/RNA helicase